MNFKPEKNENYEDFDFKIPAGHLGLYYRQDANGAPQPRAYFRPDPEKQAAIRDIYTNRWPGKRLIGFSWRSGNPTVGQERSISLDQLIPVLSNQDCQFINLQYDATDKDFVALEEKTGIKIYCDPLVDPMQDLDGLAAQVAALDLVISTTNTTVHMSGAVGVPTWVLLPRVPDWRWQLGRSDSLWYPNMQLFRREKNEPWETVIDRIQKRLMKGPQ